MLSTPAHEVSLRLSINDEIPAGENVMVGITLVSLVREEKGDVVGSSVNTETKAALKRFAHSTSSTVSPPSLVSVTLCLS